MRRHVVNGTILGGVLVAFWACSSNPPAKNTTHPDAGHGDAGTSVSASSGASGSALTGATSSGGSSGTHGSTGSASTGSGSSGSTGCSHRADCPNALACINGVCGAEGPDAGCTSNDQCIKAFICEAEKCVAGCDGNVDCHGTNLPKCILGNPGHCGACTANTDCVIAGDSSTDNQVCQNGKCVTPAMCSSPSACGNLGCVDGFCASCTSDSQCTPNTTHCDPILADGGGTGFCIAGPAGCTDDGQCQALNGNNLNWYCASGQCELGSCPPASACNPPIMGCCDPSVSVCSTTTHTCVALGSTTGTTGTTASPTTGTIGSVGSTGSTGTTASPTTGGTGSTGTTGCSCDSCESQGGTCDQANNCACTLPGGINACCATQNFFQALACEGGSLACVLGCCDPINCCMSTIPVDAGPPGACTYQDTLGDNCQDDCTCGPGLVCTNGTQTFSPTNTNDQSSCLAAWNNGCVSNFTCEPAPVVDAGPPDAGPVDAGPADAGSDADRDAGPPDAG